MKYTEKELSMRRLNDKELAEFKEKQAFEDFTFGLDSLRIFIDKEKFGKQNCARLRSRVSRDERNPDIYNAKYLNEGNIETIDNLSSSEFKKQVTEKSLTLKDFLNIRNDLNENKSERGAELKSALEKIKRFYSLEGKTEKVYFDYDVMQIAPIEQSAINYKNKNEFNLTVEEVKALSTFIETSQIDKRKHAIHIPLDKKEVHHERAML